MPIPRLTLAILLAPAAFAQSSRPQFEVASVRAFAPGQGPAAVGIHMDRAQLHAVGLSLKDYLSTAYNIKALLISGPHWTETDRFDITATLPAGTTPAQVPEMLQSLLADRFRVKLHKDQKEFPVYALVTGKGPLKLKESPPDPNAQKDEAKGTFNNGTVAFVDGVTVSYLDGSSFYFGNNRVEAKKLNTTQFTRDMERFSDRQIVDMTGLTGQYDFAFSVSPEDYQAMMLRSLVWLNQKLPPEAQRFLDSTSPAALGDALEQVGLKLEPRRAPLDVLVIDDALKTPTPKKSRVGKDRLPLVAAR